MTVLFTALFYAVEDHNYVLIVLILQFLPGHTKAPPKCTQRLQGVINSWRGVAGGGGENRIII